MQSSPVPVATGGSESLFKGYSLWLLAIGAIVYAYVFATSANASSYRGINTTTDPVTGAPMDNVGNQVSLLLGAILAYMGVVKLWSNGQYQIPDGLKWIGSVLNAFIAFGLLIGLVFVSIRATQYSINLNQITAQDSIGFFGSTISVMGLMLIALIVMAVKNGTDSVFPTLMQSAQFVLNFWFPLVMMYYFIRLGSNYWFQIVAGVSLSITILLMCQNWYKLTGLTTATVPTVPETLHQMVKDLWNTFPIAPYLKYVANTDLMEVAKRVMVFALLCYVAYLMISVYRFKHRLIPCAGTDFASCFGLGGGSSDGSKDTPYVNALVWTLIASVGVNAANWVMQLFPIYNWINDRVNGTTTTPPSSNMTMGEKALQLLKLVAFPFYWTFSLFVNYPVATVGAFMAFAALGLLLYRSSFDLTAFVEGQRGTVITLFTMFIASLVVFGVYIYTKSPTADIEQDTVTYGQFIGKTGLAIAFAACIVGLVLYFLNSHSKLTTVVSVVQFGITALIYITGIAIALGLARVMFSTSRRMGGSMFQVSPYSNWVVNVLKMVGNLLFYLPCLMLDFADMLKEQYGLTTQTALILLALEAAFILAGHLLPSAVARAINHTGVQILSAPISMNAARAITTYDVQFVNAHGAEDITPNGGVATTTVRLKNYSYGVSAWFYIHPQPPNTNANYDSDNYINLIQLGSRGPSIQYNPKNNTVQFGLYGTPIDLVVNDITLQTWNNVVINSDKGAVDIFINNKLIYTGHHVPNTNDPVPNAVNNVTVGQADGVRGEMCNVVLNTAPFTKPEIAWLYKTNKVLNPPVVGVNMDPLNQGESAGELATEAINKDTPAPTPMPTFSTYGASMYGILGAIIGAIFGWLFNHESHAESAKGLVMGALVFGLMGAGLGALFSTDGTVAYVLKTVANVFVDTF
jgi:hypothetical protein